MFIEIVLNKNSSGVICCVVSLAKSTFFGVGIQPQTKYTKMVASASELKIECFDCLI